MKQRQKITRRKCPSEDFPKNRYFPNYAILHRHLYGFLKQLKQSSGKQRVNTGTMNFLQYILAKEKVLKKQHVITTEAATRGVLKK